MFERYINNRFLILYLFPFLIGSSTVFSFAPFNYTFINFIVLPLFFYLTVHIKKKSKSTYRKKPFKLNLFIYGTSFGFGFYLSGIYWITNSLTFDESFKILIPIGLIFIPLFLSLFFSLVTFTIGPFLNFNFSSILLMSAVLSFSDFVRAKILTGFPWNLWVYTFNWATEIIQILSLIGLFAFNLLSITIFLLPSVLFLNLSSLKKASSIGFILLTFLILYIYGNFTINQNEKYLANISQKFNVKVVSPNFPLRYGLTIDQIEKRLSKLIRYSEPDKNVKTLFIWPEGVFSGYAFNEILTIKKVIRKNFSDNHYILFGINIFDENKNGFYNSLVLVNNKLEIIQEYRKQKLVPFGEFLPFENIMNKLGLKKITEGHGSFISGKEQNNISLDNLNILPLICYEVIFTELIQKSHEDTNLIINISEDGWFGNSIGPFQHFSKGIFRAIEQNSFLIRSANKGVSAIINNKGEVLKELNIKESGNIELDVPIIKSNKINKNDLIFFTLLFTYILFFKFAKNIYVKK